MQAFGSPLDGQELNEMNVMTLLAPEHQALLELTMTVLLAPLWTGITMSAIFSMRNQPIKFTTALQYYSRFTILAFASAIISILLTIGLQLFILPGLYLFIATTFTLPLIIERNLTPLRAIGLSIKAVNANLGKLITIYSLFFLLFVIVIISFGIAYIFVGPLYFNVKAVLYQNLFGNIQAVDETPKEQQGIFDA